MIKVVHSSKYIDYIFNFTATENNLSWSLTSEGDGELFLNPLTNGLSTNVASFTVGGAAPTFPISLTNGASKSVTIVKTTNGQTASLTLRQRRATNKAVSYNVPDFGAYTGRYIYVLLNNNTVQKLDSQLLLPSDYAGTGVWTVYPVVATITLPTLPDGSFYSKIKFVTVGGIERMLLMSSNILSAGTRFHFSYIVVSNDTVTDLSGNLNTYTTQIIHGAAKYGNLLYCTYDYIRQYVYLITNSGSNGTAPIRLNLPTNTFTASVYSYTGDPLNILEKQFSPIDLQFITVGDYDPSIPRVFNHKLYPNNGGIWGYRYRDNSRKCTGDVFGRIAFFNSFGAIIGGNNFGAIGVYACTELYGFDRTNTVFMSYIDNYSIVNLTTSSAKIRQTDKELASPNNYLLNLRQCYFSNIYVAFCGTSGRVLSTRMVVFKESETNADFGYLDFSNNVYSADANQLLL